MTAAPDEVRRRPVGVFDSGVGGLTVLHELLVRLPHEDYVYLADSARLPYGERRPDELRAFALEVADALLARGIKLLVVACNSAAAAALPALQARLAETRVRRRGARRRPARRRAGRGRHAPRPRRRPRRRPPPWRAAPTPPRSPPRTRSSRWSPSRAATWPRGSSAATIDAPLLAAVRSHCAPLRDAEVDTVILGCTHYPLVEPIIQRMLGPDVAIITSGAPLARQVQHVLGTRGLDRPGTGEGAYGFMCTGDPEAFERQGTRFLQLPLGPVEQVEVGPAERLVGSPA